MLSNLLSIIYLFQFYSLMGNHITDKSHSFYLLLYSSVSSFIALSRIILSKAHCGGVHVATMTPTFRTCTWHILALINTCQMNE